jgi:cold shock protein
VVTGTIAEVITGAGEITGKSKTEAMKGTVKWYDRVKGYGFIQTEEEKDIFIHRSGLETAHTELEAGQKVEFEIEQREKGPVATKVRKVD